MSVSQHCPNKFCHWRELCSSVISSGNIKDPTLRNEWYYEISDRQPSRSSNTMIKFRHSRLCIYIRADQKVTRQTSSPMTARRDPSLCPGGGGPPDMALLAFYCWFAALRSLGDAFLPDLEPMSRSLLARRRCPPQTLASLGESFYTCKSCSSRYQEG